MEEVTVLRSPQTIGVGHERWLSYPSNLTRPDQGPEDDYQNGRLDSAATDPAPLHLQWTANFHGKNKLNTSS